jgi:hypothetical protein
MFSEHYEDFVVRLRYGNVIVARWRLNIDQHQRCYLKTANINVKNLLI